MKLVRVNRWVIVSYLALVLIDIIGFAAVEYLDDVRQEAEERHASALKAAETLEDRSRRMAEHVRSFVATGQVRHELEYRSLVQARRLSQEAVGSLQEQGLTRQEVALVERMRTYQDALITLNEQALQARKTGDQTAALRMVHGNEYEKNLADTNSALNQLSVQLVARIANEKHVIERRLTSVVVFTLAMTVVNALLAIAVLGFFYRRRLLEPLEAMNQGLQVLQAGGRMEPLPFVNEDSEVGTLARSLSVYSQTREAMGDQQWIKTEQARLASLLQGATSFSELARVFLREMAPLAKVGHGLFYVADGRELRLIAQYAHRERKGLGRSFAWGEGLVGQCAVEKSPIVVRRPPPDYLPISSSLGEAQPSAIMVLPIVSKDRVLGVVELATLGTFGAREQGLLDALLPVMALTMEVLERNVSTQRLLEATQEQAHRLEEQAVQMTLQTEEIEAQRSAIAAIASEQEAIFESVSTGVAVIKDRRVLKCNQQLAVLFGTPGVDLVGQSVRQWYPDDESFAAVGQAYQQVALGEPVRLDVPMVRADGSPIWVRLNGRAIDVHDMDKGVVWTLEDISQEHTAADEMRRAREMAEDAARTKSDFLANMSHEIRTPMNAIIGMAHLALKTELNPRQRDYVRKIQQSGQHLLGIINDILDFSKIEAGKLSLESTEFDLNAVMDNVASLIGEKAAAKGLELIFDVEPAVATQWVGDPLRLGQILINYCNNAVKFTEHGEISVRVSVVEDRGDADLVRFEVRDTGIGLSDEQKARLFQSFSQADTSTTRKYGGTGLGLAISKNLAELMGGSVGVESVLGQGSTFWFMVPLRKAAGRSRELLLKPDLRGRRVLVIDDNEYARMVLVDMLKSMSFQADEADGAARGIELISAADRAGRPYEVVFSDWQMPELDGLEAGRRIRALPLTCKPHLIMVTAYGREEVMKGAAEVGFEEVLIKPVNPSLLFDAAMRAFGQSEAAEGVEARGEPARASRDVSSIAGARILLVEDNELNQEVAAELLKEVGLLVEVAADGQLAIDALKAHPQGYFDLVLMDMQMPVLDGVSATKMIRQMPEQAMLPIVAMTANAMQADKERCLEAGMNDYLAKPIEPDLLWQALLRWVRPRIRQEAPVAEPQLTDTAAAPAVQGLGQVPGLNMADGLRRVMGRQALYESVLRKFLAGGREFDGHMRAALSAEDWPTAERLAHTLKGTAGSVGATPVQEAALNLETLIKSHASNGDIEAAFAALNDLLGALLKALEGVLSGATQDHGSGSLLSGEAAVTAAWDKGAALAASRRLAALLRESNASSEDEWRAHEALFQAAFPTHAGRIESSIRDFDHEQALEALVQAAHEHGWELSS